jgi:hypothetical protein
MLFVNKCKIPCDRSIYSERNKKTTGRRLCVRAQPFVRPAFGEEVPGVRRQGLLPDGDPRAAASHSQGGTAAGGLEQGDRTSQGGKEGYGQRPFLHLLGLNFR